MKIYGGNVNTNFQGKKIPKETTLCKCFSLIMLDSVYKQLILPGLGVFDHL